MVSAGGAGDHGAGDQDEPTYKQKLHRGGYSILIIYFSRISGSDALRYCGVPTSVEEGPV